MNKTKNNLQKLFAILILSGLSLLISSATASAWSFYEWLFGDTLTTIMVIVICVAFLALIGLFVYLKFFTVAGTMSNLKP